MILGLIGPKLMATHVVGGEIFYSYLGNDEYELTLIVYRDCGPTNTNGTPFDSEAQIGVFETGSSSMFFNFTIDLFNAEVEFVPIELENPCFILPPDVCVERATYTEIISLPELEDGYTIVYQRCCRNPSIVNLNIPQQQGVTFSTHIPGPNEIDGNNSSAQFTNFPPVALCKDAEFFFDHGATDADGDSLVYEFCTPLQGATPDEPAPVPSEPPYNEIVWGAGYSADYPIDSAPPFSIDPNTGLITGTATELGQYVMGVCVSEYRDGVLINSTNRDFQFNVTSCDPNIISSIPEQTDFCTGLTITFENTSTNATFFHWDFGVEGIDTDTSNLSSPSFTYPEQGVYTVTLVANPGWPCADSSQTTFTALPVISPAITYGGYECINGNDHFDFAMTGNVSPQATYLWDFGAGSVPQTSTSPSPQSIMMNGEAATMEVLLVVQDNGCEETAEESVENMPDPVADIVDQTAFCNGFIYTFENDATNATEYLWNFGVPGNSDFSTDPNPTFEFTQAGTYDVMLVASAPLTCSDTTFMQLEIFGVIEPEFDDYEVQCLGEHQLDFSGTGATTATAQYTWNFGVNATPATFSGQNPQNVVFNTVGEHEVTLVIAENGCSESYSSTIEVADHFITDFSVNNSAGCPGLLVQMEGGAISDVPVYYLWDFGDGGTSFQNNTTYTYLNPGIYDVTVTAYTLAGCRDSLTINFPNAVQIYPNPQPGFIIEPQIVSILDAETMVIDSSFGGASCYYYMSDGGESEDCEFLYSWTQSGIQTITQYVTSEYGCTSSVTGTVIIEGFTFYAPNSFTPNDDGLNDIWKPVMTGITKFSLKIFNRWGDLIFETTDPEKGWMGQVEDGDHYATNGIYNYVVLADDLLSKPHEFVGHIMVTR
jgi:gliding motility-associated-like protein